MAPVNGTNGKRFWSTKEAAAYLNIHPVTLTTLLKRRTAKEALKNRRSIITPMPPHRRFGRNLIRFPMEEFKAWADGDYYVPTKRT